MGQPEPKMILDCKACHKLATCGVTTIQLSDWFEYHVTLLQDTHITQYQNKFFAINSTTDDSSIHDIIAAHCMVKYPTRA